MSAKEPSERDIRKTLKEMLGPIHNDIKRLAQVFHLSYSDAAALLAAFNLHELRAMSWQARSGAGKARKKREK